MWTLIEDHSEIREAQAKLRYVIETTWSYKEQRLVAWRPESAKLVIHHNGSLWFGGRELKRRPTPRFWNAFGEYKPGGNLQIDVEVNIPTNSNSRRIAGFFARDAFGRACLLHDGSVGGGRPGIGRKQFLWWLFAISKRSLPVIDKKGQTRCGILVANLEVDGAEASLSEFIKNVILFKGAVSRGLFKRPAILKSLQDFTPYFREFSGTKRRSALAAIEYVTRHGDIVHALRKWRAVKSDEEEIKTALIDWGICRGGRLCEIYEVKTSCERQALYGAIGQLLVHSGSSNCKKIIVLPENDAMPPDIERALAALNISQVHYKLSSRSARVTTSRRKL